MASSTGDKALRADARRNRDAMLAAARRVFAREGLDAPLDMIAREAGVARATQHRHFPTRESIIRSIFDDNLDEIARVTREADPADAYVTAVLVIADIVIRDRGFVDLFHRRGVSDEIREDISQRFLSILDEPMRAAKAAGRVRADLRLDDTTLLVDMLSAAALTGPARPPDRMTRAVMLVLEAIAPRTTADAGSTRAVVATAYGGPEVLRLIATAVPAPGPGEALIEVRAAGTNPADCKFYSGNLGRDPALLPMRLGLEVAGVVAAVGEDAEGPCGPIDPGDEVVAYRVEGGYADRIVAPGASVLPKPSTLSFEEAAGMMAAGATAVHALAVLGLHAGDTLLIHGASGGVGVVAVQLAVSAGVRVIGTASERNHEFLRELGAEPVSYGEGLQRRVRALAPEGTDAAIDAVGSDEALDVSLALVADRSRIVTLLPRPRAFEEGIKSIGGRPPSDPGTEIRNAARLELVRLAEQEKLRIVVSASYPLAHVADAHRTLATGHTRGKIVLVP